MDRAFTVLSLGAIYIDGNIKDPHLLAWLVRYVATKVPPGQRKLLLAQRPQIFTALLML